MMMDGRGGAAKEDQKDWCKVGEMGPPVANPKPSFLVRLVEKASDVTRSVGVVVLAFSSVLG